MADSNRNLGRYAAPYMLIVLTAVNTINWADRQVVPILFPGIRAELGLSDAQLGILSGLAFSLVYALSSFAFGRAADYRRRRNLVAAGLLGWSLATAAGGFATGFTTLIAARFFIGVGEASLYPSAMSWIAERYPGERQGRAMGIFGSAAALGGGLGVAVGGWLSATLGWRWVFFIYGGLGILLVPLVLSVPESVRDRDGTESGETMSAVLWDLVQDKRLILLWTAGLFMMAGGIGYSHWVPSLFQRERGFSVEVAGLLFGGSLVIGGILGSVGGGILADRFRKDRVAGELDVSFFAVILALPLVALTLVPAPIFVLVAAGILAPIPIFAFFPSLQTMLMEIVPPQRHGLAYAVHILFLGGIGTGLGPFVIGVISDATGNLNLAMTASIGFMILSMIFVRSASWAIRAAAVSKSTGTSRA
jgi:predicted MFS family arabinose efflux permease